MSSFWNNNLALFCKRFPALAQQFGITENTTFAALVGEDAMPFELVTAKNGSLTAKEVRSQRLLHSQYNPEREATQACLTAHTEETRAAAFWGFGLGYAPNAYAARYPTDAVILVEPDARYLFAALFAIDWTPLFTLPSLVLAIQAEVDDVTRLMEQAGGAAGAGSAALEHCAIITNNAHTAHAADYFASLAAALQRAKQKAKVNSFTLEKFSQLWLRNSCRNLRATATLNGVARYEGKCPSELPALILAAGPTLQQVLPQLAALKKRMLLICVDTALRACLQAGVEPDFILLLDPQYYAYRHIAGLAAPSAVFITESAVYPAALRFPCRERILCSSLFPLGKYFEKQLGSKGVLAAGGSVATTAWDFARYCGAKRIYCAGLDLGFPKLQTHIRGATFEEKLHTTATRTHTAETGSVALLFGANMKKAVAYNGNTLITDDRMQLFAWWFERAAASYPALESYTLSEESLAIPGFKSATLADLLAAPEKPAERRAFFAAEHENSAPASAATFDQALHLLQEGLTSLYQLAKRGIRLADEGLANRHKSGIYLQALEEIDTQLVNSAVKDIAALVFPTERQLNELFSALPATDKVALAFQRSKIIYHELQKSITAYTKLLA